jgi:hypothetical protein
MATNEPGVPESTNTEQQNRSYIASGGQDGDRGEKKGTSIPGKQQTPEANPKTPITDRMRNPLGDFSSYTYQITLYMISPAAYNAFVETGRTNINAIGSTQTLANRASNSNDGVFIVAQSGGINRQQNRAPYLDLDYYIDDLKITSNISGASTRSATNVTEMSFKIVEPYGFSFLTQLKLASDTLVSTSSGIAGYNSLTNSLKQFFIVGIRFLGYDAQGNIIDPSLKYTGTDMSKNMSGALMERFYDIAINKLQFKLDGRATVYNIGASVLSSLVGFGIKFGRIDKNAEIEAENVEQALTNLATKLNSIQGDATTTYQFKFVGDGIDDLKKAKFYSDADLNKLNSGMSIAKTTTQVTDAVGIGEIPQLTKKQFKINNSTSVLQQVDDIITQSEYLIKALSTVYKSNLQAKQNINSQRQDNQNENKEVQWYHISADVKVNNFDKKRNDYTYNITYVIEPYKTPVVNAAYIPNVTPYYGPVKRYDYYFTGQNTEIISYDQTLNNAFFNTVADTNLTPENYERANQSGQVSISANKRQDQSRLGTVNLGNETTNGFRTVLYDPNAYANAKIVILGDPDYLSQENTSSVANAVYRRFYGPNYSINANGGQVFIEINFNEARDYDADTKTGLLDVNDRILFWKYPKDIKAKAEGIIYLVTTVISSFSKGKFTQELACQLPGFAIGPNEEENQRTLQVDENQTSAEATRLLRSATSSTSQVVAPPVNPTNPSPTKTTTAGSSDRTVPSKPPLTETIQQENLRRFGNRTLNNNKPDPVKDDDGGNRPPGPFQVGA